MAATGAAENEPNPMRSFLWFLLGVYLTGGAFIIVAVKDDLDFGSREPEWKKWLCATLGGFIWPVGIAWSSGKVLWNAVRTAFTR